MKIPDNFEDLNNLFKKSEDDAPVDFSEYLKTPISKMVFKLGKSIKRLAELQKLMKSEFYEEGSLNSFYEDSFRLCKKYISVLKARKEEFIKYIQEIDTGDTPEYLIMENLPHICVAIVHTVEGNEDTKDDTFDSNEPQSDGEFV